MDYHSGVPFPLGEERTRNIQDVALEKKENSWWFMSSHVSGCAVAGSYELLVADLLFIVVEVWNRDGLFYINADISTLQEGEFSTRLI